MADVTFGVKVPEELKMEISQLMQKSGQTGKDFMQDLISGYKIDKAKAAFPVVAEDLDELTKLTRRINDIYLNMGYRIDTIINEKQLKINELKEIKEKEMRVLKERLQENKDELVNLKKDNHELVNLNEELAKRLEGEVKNKDNLEALMNEYKEKSDTLAGMLIEYKQYKEQNTELLQHIQTLTSEKIPLTERIEGQDHTIATLKKTIEQIEEQAQSDLAEATIKNQEALRVASEKAEMRLEKTLLGQEKKSSEAINKLKVYHSSEIAEYQGKYREFLNDIEDIRSRNEATIIKMRDKHQEEINQLETELGEAREKIEQLAKNLEEVRRGADYGE